MKKKKEEPAAVFNERRQDEPEEKIDEEILSDIVNKLHNPAIEEEALKHIIALPEPSSVDIPLKTEEEKAKEAELMSRPLFPPSKPDFMFKFSSGKISTTEYSVLAKTYEEALQKIKTALTGSSDASQLKFISMTQKEILSTEKKD
jgi:hypothetical protein